MSEARYITARSIYGCDIIKVLKERSEYLENQMNNAKSQIDYVKNTSYVISIIGFIGIIIFVIFYNFANIIASAIILILGLIVLFSNTTYDKQFANCYKGIGGEQTVIDALSSLDNNYYLINDIILPERNGNIDHLVLGPNGIFVIETKNYEGNIICYGDDWYRRYLGYNASKDYPMESPSRQVKRNAVNLKQFLLNKNDEEYIRRTWVNGIVVFTNPYVNLELNDPSVAILRPEELCDHIKLLKCQDFFSLNELNAIADTILGMPASAISPSVGCK